MKWISLAFLPLLFWLAAFACSQGTQQGAAAPEVASPPTASLTSPDAGVGACRGVAHVPPPMPSIGGAGGGVGVGSSGAGAGGAGAAGGLPICEWIRFPQKIEDCTAHGWVYHMATGMCVESCSTDEEEIVDGNQCCTKDNTGLCCPYFLDSGGNCLTEPPGPGSYSVPPCPRRSPYWVCNALDRCVCSASP